MKSIRNIYKKFYKVKIKRIKEEGIVYTVKELLREINYFPAKEKVFIKPNLGYHSWYGSPYIVNPMVVRGVIEYLREAGNFEVIIGEGVGDCDFYTLWQDAGYEETLKDFSIKKVNLYEVKRVKRFLNDSFFLYLPAILEEVEYINIAKLKTHIQTLLSLTLKNQKGLLNQETQKAFHRNLHRNIAKLACMVKPDLAIVDGSNILAGNGPSAFGEELKLGIIIGGRDFLLVDEATSQLVGINPREVKHIYYARKFGVTHLPYLRYKSILNIQRPSSFYQGKRFRIYWSEYSCSYASILEEAICEWLNQQELSLNLGILTGPPMSPVLDKVDKVLLVGNCAIERVNTSLPCFSVAGCPPTFEEIKKRIIQEGLIK